MERINVIVHWSGNNYSCGWATPEIGTIMVTDKTLDGLKAAFEEAIQFHMDGMLADGDSIPDWLLNKEYEIDYELHTSALLRSAERYTTMAAISRATGINQKQLSHYANAAKEARPAQRQRIVEGLHKIGKEFLSVR